LVWGTRAGGTADRAHRGKTQVRDLDACALA